LPHRTYTQAELEAGYKAMAADDEYERGAMEWCNGLMCGVDDEKVSPLELNLLNINSIPQCI